MKGLVATNAKKKEKKYIVVPQEVNKPSDVREWK